MKTSEEGHPQEPVLSATAGAGAAILPAPSPAVATAPVARHPLAWVPSSYFIMGTVYFLLTQTTANIYLNLGVSVERAALYASSLGAPYTFKPLWAPLLEMFKTKKFFVVSCQVVIAGLLALAALALEAPSFVALSLACFWMIGFAGATQDIASDGVYVTSLSPRDQAKFTGFQSMCWSFGPIFGGVLIALSGVLHDHGMDFAAAWSLVLLVIAGLSLAASLYHLRFLPQGSKAENAPKNVKQAAATFVDSVVTFFQKKDVWLMIGFAVLFRSSQGFLNQVGPLFMLDAAENGGLALSNQVKGLLDGSVGTLGFVAGSLLGGWYVSRRGLRKVLFTLCVAVNVPNATYILLAWLRPDDVYLIGTLVTLEKFWFGFGAVGHMLYMMQQLAPGKYQTAHYAFGTALMGLCLTLTGMSSGFIQARIGYVGFFSFVMIATLPSFVISWLAPFHHREDEQPA